MKVVRAGFSVSLNLFPVDWSPNFFPKAKIWSESSIIVFERAEPGTTNKLAQLPTRILCSLAQH